MQRIVNDPNQVVEEMLRGFVAAHPERVRATANPRVIAAVNAPSAGRVGVVTGGGSGHKPAFIGYIGRNMVDAVAVGEIFTSPTARAFADAFKAANGGRGVACLYGNYAGDNMNVKMATRLVHDEGIEVKTVVANDDVPSAPRGEEGKRRGVAGEVLMWKIGGAKAALGGTLDEVIAAAGKAIACTRSVGIGLTPCTIPAVGHPNFSIEPGRMEVGIGHHGEPGIRVETLRPAKDMARMMLDIVLPDLPFAAGDELAVLVSGLGATPVMELYILYGIVADELAKSGMRVYRSYVGNYFTSLEMMGVTLTVMRLDAELKELLDLEADSTGLQQFGRPGEKANRGTAR
jgi:phosphoenolpyruvate---glycerone phosphotransferase subunit DhaK